MESTPPTMGVSPCTGSRQRAEEAVTCGHLSPSLENVKGMQVTQIWSGSYLHLHRFPQRCMEIFLENVSGGHSATPG